MGGELCGSAAGRVLGWSLAACIVVALTRVASAGSLLPGGQGDYTDQWAVQVSGGEKTARAVADELGYDFKGQVSEGLELVRRSSSRDVGRGVLCCDYMRHG